jgi:nucleotide-binding universal stress UspA family protein
MTDEQAHHPEKIRQEAITTGINKTDDKREGCKMYESLFSKILHAYDGSEQSFQALTLALAIAKRCGGELHIVSVGEVEYVPQSIGHIQEQERTAAHRLRAVLHRIGATAAENNLTLHTHLLVGHAVRDIAALARVLNVDLLVIGAKGHSALYERVVGSRASSIMQLAHCPVLAVKSNRKEPRARERLKLIAAWVRSLGPRQVEPTF